MAAPLDGMAWWAVGMKITAIYNRKDHAMDTTIDARQLLAILRDHDMDDAEVEGEAQEFCATGLGQRRYSCARLNEWLDANSPYGADF